MNYTFDKDGGCRPELDELEQGVRTACAAERVPVILGFRIEKNKTIPPHLAAGMDINQRCATGALNIRSDLRMIPLRFYINDASKPTLAWSAATAVNPRLVQDPVLADDSVADKSLYTTLLTEAELADFTVDDEDVLAGSASGRLRGRVVIIGSPQNTFPTYAGNVPGYVLQASYIEALLDGRYLQRMPFFFHVAVALAFWIYLELGESVRTKLVRMAGGLAAILVLSWLTVHLFGYYSDFLMISMGGVFTWLFEVATKQFRERRPA